MESSKEAKHRLFREMYFEMYRVYHGYHGQKETLVWVAANAYIVFSGVAVGWIFTNHATWTGCSVWWFIGIIFAVWILSTLFAWKQNFYKADSVRINGELRETLEKIGTKEEPSLEWLRMLADQPKTGRFKIVWDGGRVGLLLILQMIILGVAQIALVFILFFDP